MNTHTHIHTHVPFSLCCCCVRPCWLPHVIICVSDLVQELVSQNRGPLQTLGLLVWTAPVYTDQINWTHTGQQCEGWKVKGLQKKNGPHGCFSITLRTAADKGLSTGLEFTFFRQHTLRLLRHLVHTHTLTIEVWGVAVSWAGVSQGSKVGHHVTSSAAVNSRTRWQQDDKVEELEDVWTGLVDRQQDQTITPGQAGQCDHQVVGREAVQTRCGLVQDQNAWKVWITWPVSSVG